MDINTTGFMFFIGIITSLALIVLAYIFIVPDSKREKLNTLGKFIHDIFNFKFLIIEKIMQFLYIVATVSAVCIGISMLFGFSVYYSSYFDELYTHWYGWYGLLLAIVGPFAIRLAYEGIMLFILLVKNVMQINKKLKDQVNEGEYKFPGIKELVAKDNFDFMKKSNADSSAQPADTQNNQEGSN